MSCKMACLKYFTFFLNLVFLTIGLLLLASGTVLQAVYRNYLSYLGDDINLGGLLLWSGLVISLLAWLGCWGSIREAPGLTCVYTALLTVIFSLEVVLGLTAYHSKDAVREWLGSRLIAGMMNFKVAGYGGVTETWNVIQHELGCCGTLEYRDWVNTSFSQGRDVPDSCCLSDVVGCGSGILNLPPIQASMRVHTSGCMQHMLILLQENNGMIVGICVALAFTQIFAIIFAIFFGNNVKKGLEHV